MKFGRLVTLRRDEQSRCFKNQQCGLISPYLLASEPKRLVQGFTRAVAGNPPGAPASAYRFWNSTPLRSATGAGFRPISATLFGNRRAHISAKKTTINVVRDLTIHTYRAFGGVMQRLRTSIVLAL